MTVVRNTVRDAAGVAAPRARVTVRLVAGAAPNSPGYSTDGSVVAAYNTRAGVDGIWSITLPANSTLTPDGTYYEVVEQPVGGRAHVHTIEVPASGGPHDLVDVLVVAPGDLAALGATTVQLAIESAARIAGDAASVATAAADATSKANAAQVAAVAASTPRPPAALQLWAQAAAGAAYAPVNVFVVGSSSVDGLLASTLSRQYVSVLADRLKARHNAPGVTGGIGVNAHSTASGWTTSGGSLVTASNLGLGYVVRELTVGAYMERTATCTSVTIFYLQGSGAGQFTVAFDGGAATTVTPSTSGAANQQTGVFSSSTVAAGSHTVRIAGVGTARIEAVYFHNGDESSGVRVWNGGRAGTTSAQLSFNIEELALRVATVKPALILVEQHKNDFSTGIALATTESRNRAFVAAMIAAANPPPLIGLVHSYPAAFGVDPDALATWDEFGAMLQGIADDFPNTVMLIDTSSVWPANATDDVYDVIDTDVTHMTDRGHRLAADLLDAALAVSPHMAARTSNLI